MKRLTLVTYATIAVAAVLTANYAISQDKPAAGSKPQSSAGTPSMEEMMQKCIEAGTPGAAHKALEPLAGEWNVSSKMWMSPDSPPTESKGTASARWVFGGRYLQEEFKGEMMGKPFNGMALTGFDNLKQKYVSVWVDDMSTAIFKSEGKADAQSKVFTFEGKADCPMTGQKDKPMKHIIRIDSPDKHTFEMHDLTLGTKSRTAEIVYTRK